LRITSGVQRSARISDARAIGQYSRYDRMSRQCPTLASYSVQIAR